MKDNIKYTNQNLTNAICVSSFVSVFMIAALNPVGLVHGPTGRVSCALLTQDVMKSFQRFVMWLTLVI